MRATIITALAVAVCAALADAGTHDYTVYFNEQGYQFEVYDVVGGEPTLDFYLYNKPDDGATQSNVYSAGTHRVYYRVETYPGTNAYVSLTGTVVSVASSGITNTVARFNISNGWFWTQMTDYKAALVVTDTNTDRTVSMARGRQTLEAGYEIGGTFNAPTGTMINASLYTWLNWRDNGPMTAGTNITFGPEDDDGRFSINADTGTLAVALQSLWQAADDLATNAAVMAADALAAARDMALTNASLALAYAYTDGATGTVYALSTNAADQAAAARGIAETQAVIAVVDGRGYLTEEADTNALAQLAIETNRAIQAEGVLQTGKQDYAANLDEWSGIGTNDYASGLESRWDADDTTLHGTITAEIGETSVLDRAYTDGAVTAGTGALHVITLADNVTATQAVIDVVDGRGFLTSETDPLWAAWRTNSAAGTTNAIMPNGTLVNIASPLALADSAVQPDDTNGWETGAHQAWLLWSTAPAATNSTGTAGEVAYDFSHVYVCVSNATWRRATLATWE